MESHERMKGHEWKSVERIDHVVIPEDWSRWECERCKASLWSVNRPGEKGDRVAIVTANGDHQHTGLAADCDITLVGRTMNA